MLFRLNGGVYFVSHTPGVMSDRGGSIEISTLRIQEFEQKPENSIAVGCLSREPVPDTGKLPAFSKRPLSSRLGM